MNFRPELAEKVMRGEKTVTRRVPSANPRSPWYAKRCALVPGRPYAVCPGRGKHAIGRVRVVRVALVRLGFLTVDEAQREGFDSGGQFLSVWRDLHGSYDYRQLVWRVEFEVPA